LAGLHVDGVDVTVPAIIVDPTPAGVTSGGSAIT